MREDQSPSHLTLVDNRAMANRVADVIREAIFRGRLVPGERLQEERLAAETGVSRGPVREALVRLEAEGLVVREPYRGARVAAPSKQDLVDLFALRETLEAMTMELATPHITGEDIRQLRSLLVEEKVAVARDDGSHSRLSHDFHKLVRDRCPNRYLREYVAQLWNQFPKSMRSLRPHRIHQTVEEYEAILNAVQAGDAELAAALMARHVRNGAKSLLAIYDQHQQLHADASRPPVPDSNVRLRST